MSGVVSLCRNCWKFITECDDLHLNHVSECALHKWWRWWQEKKKERRIEKALEVSNGNVTGNAYNNPGYISVRHIKFSNKREQNTKIAFVYRKNNMKLYKWQHHFFLSIFFAFINIYLPLQTVNEWTKKK